MKREWWWWDELKSDSFYGFLWTTQLPATTVNYSTVLFSTTASIVVSFVSSSTEVKPVSDPRMVNIGSEPKSSINVFNADGNDVTSATS